LDPVAVRKWSNGEELRAMGASLSRVGILWLLTVFGPVNIDLDNGIRIVPFLWFAPPFLLTRMLAAARNSHGRIGQLLLAAVAIGWAAWLVAVPASLLGWDEVLRTAQWLGTQGGALLYCTAMLRLTSSLRWADHARRWRQTQLTLGIANAVLLGAGAIALLGGILDDEGDGILLVATGVAVVSLVLGIVGLIRLSRIHASTTGGLAEIPDEALPDELRR